MSLRSLADLSAAATARGIDVIQTTRAEVLMRCPICRRGGSRQLASIEIIHGAPVAHCNGCERWGDDPQDILRTLGCDEDAGDEHEIVLRIFDLWLCLERKRRTGEAT